jgi:sugar phosphate isomerase/epimerase
MKLSCVPVSFFQPLVSGEMALEEWFTIAREIGLDGVECSIGFLTDTSHQRLSQLRSAADAEGLQVHVLTCQPNFTHPDARCRNEQLDMMRGNLHIASALGAQFVRVTAGQRHPETSVEDGIAWAIEGISRLADFARHQNLTLAYENHSKSAFWQYGDFSQPEEIFLAIANGLRDADGVGVNFDTANPVAINVDPVDLYEKVWDRVVTVHVNETARAGAYEPAVIGQGVVPFADIFAAMQSHGYDGWLSMEETSRTGRKGIEQGARFIRETWARVKDGS